MCNSCHENHHGNGKGHCNCQPSGKIERFIQPTLLLSLVQQPSHGYELLERLSHFRFYSGNPDTGAVYRHLRRLENDGYVESRWETGEAGPAKRTYSITPDGITLLHAWADDFLERKAAIEDFLQKYQQLEK